MQELPNRKIIEDLLRKGDKIGAIKAYRDQVRAGLKEAKEAVDAMERELKKV